MADHEQDHRGYPLQGTFRWPADDALPPERAGQRDDPLPEHAAQPGAGPHAKLAGQGPASPGPESDAGFSGSGDPPGFGPRPRPAPAEPGPGLNPSAAARGEREPASEPVPGATPWAAGSGMRSWRTGAAALGRPLGAAGQPAPSLGAGRPYEAGLRHETGLPHEDELPYEAVRPLQPPPGFGAGLSAAPAGEVQDAGDGVIEETFGFWSEPEWDDGARVWDDGGGVPASVEAERGGAASADDWETRARAWAEGGRDWADRDGDDSLAADLLLRRRRDGPQAGWRRVVYQATGGLLRPAPSAAQRRERDLASRARTPVAGGHHRVAVLSLKGGVGKTTTVMGLGLTLASLRGDRVVALDANPDRGTLCDKLRLETAATVRDLVAERDRILRYADVRAYTTQAAGQLEVLASDRDPTVSVAFSEEDYRDAARVLERHYSICITDCGTGLLHSAMAGVLDLADQIVLVSTASVDAARSASATLDWLAAHEHGDLARGAVVALTMIRRRGGASVDLGRLEEHFEARCRSVVRIPWDPHLDEGAEVDLEALGTSTSEAFLELAAEVGDGFAWPRRRSASPRMGVGKPGSHGE